MDKTTCELIPINRTESIDNNILIARFIKGKTHFYSLKTDKVALTEKDLRMLLGGCIELRLFILKPCKLTPKVTDVS